jgi:pantoate--beta-alanine ligase
VSLESNQSQWQLAKNKGEWQKFREQLPASTPVALVPTMGNLHAGHLSLLDRALSEHSVVVLTIFVNQLQFGPHEDFANYPRTLELDCQKLTHLLETRYPQDKRLFIFAPTSPHEVFPEGHSSSISVGPLTQILCGIKRPIHFDGVTTVVYALFALFKPAKAYFGLKDFQQFFIIKKMVRDLSLPIELEGGEIVRDHDGLALSSRNAYLSSEDRLEALTLMKTLRQLAAIPCADESDAKNLQWQMQEIVKSNDKWEYLEVVDAQTLLAPNSSFQELVLLGAYRLGKTRLIDNITIKRSKAC